MNGRPNDSPYAPDDPRRIRSIAVTTDDVVTALEANVRRDVGAVLRVTPPFNARERGRIHRSGGEGDYEGAGESLHLDPRTLVSDVPAYPSPDDTEDELRKAGEYTPERHRERHVAAVEAWRESVASAIVEELTLPTPAGDHAVDIKSLG